VAKVIKVLPKGTNLENVDVWFQDEMRVGQQGTTTRMWSKKGTRPIAIKQLQFTNAFVYGAVCPNQNTASSIIMPFVGTEAMQIHVNEISKKVPAGRHAIVVFDQAAWHTTKKLIQPKNVSFLPLPPYSPELNPVEQVWQFLRQHYLSNRVFDGYEDIISACVDAWNNFLDIPNKVNELCSRSWASVSVN